jgi:uncharacterized membrane protein (DUF4010 family)
MLGLARTFFANPDSRPRGDAIEQDLLLRLSTALGVGLLVGVERAWRQRDERDGGRTAGVRTYALIGLLGGVAGALSGAATNYVPWVASLAILTTVFAVFSFRQGNAEQDFSVTSVVAAMVVFSLGVMAVLGDLRLAAATAVVTAGLLASRTHLHRAVARLSWPELRSALLLLGMTAVVLPVLPDRPIDPLGALNPSELWRFMILTAAISYVGYIALKIGGPEKGPPLAGLAGGLASSTATTLAMARLSRRVEDGLGLAAGVSFAAMVSIARATFLAAIVAPGLLAELAAPCAAAALVFAVGGGMALLKRTRGLPAADALSVPFELGAVFGFGVLLAAVMLAGAWLAATAGAAGTYLLAGVSGLVDIDAITLSLSRRVAQGGSLSLSASAILVALAANAVQRVILAWSFGARPFALRFAVVSAAALAAGGAAIIAF